MRVKHHPNYHVYVNICGQLWMKAGILIVLICTCISLGVQLGFLLWYKFYSFSIHPHAQELHTRAGSRFQGPPRPPPTKEGPKESLLPPNGYNSCVYSTNTSHYKTTRWVLIRSFKKSNISYTNMFRIRGNVQHSLHIYCMPFKYLQLHSQLNSMSMPTQK